MVRRIFQLISIVAILIASFGSVGSASAWGNCSSYVTVQWGDTLSGIAQQCGTTVHAIRAANPGLGWWVYAGQVLYIPTGSPSNPGNYPPSNTGTYVVQWGDTLGKIAARTGVSWRDILAVNPQIQNPSLIYAGQVIYLPSGVVNPPPYNPPPTQPPSQPPPVELSSLRIDYKYGLYVRTQPGGPIIASGLDKTTWFYRPNSAFVDSKWRIWVEVRLYPPVKGYSTGWMLVKDQFGKYFTEPRIDS